MKAAGDGTQLYGSIIYPSYYDYGVYSFNASENITFEQVAKDDNFDVSGGGVYADGKYCFIKNLDLSGLRIVTYFVYDTNTWTKLKEIEVDATSASTDMTYDYTSGTIYGAFYDGTYDGKILGTLDIETGKTSNIGTLSVALYTISANSAGELYGIGYDGNLYKISKTDATLTLIGSTGLTPKYLQSATFDIRTDKLYWAASLADNSSGLYEVNTSTGAANLISQFISGEEVVGLYILPPAAKDGAPAAVSDLSASFEEGRYNGTVSFKMPTTTYGGSPLSGNINYTVKFSGEVKATGTAAAGSEVKVEVKGVSPAMHTISVVPSNEVGNGPETKTTKWIGKDTPKGVTNLILKKTEGANGLTLTWDAPTEGANGGYLDAGNLKYKVVRYPDNKVVAPDLTETTFSETIEEGPLSSYWYDVTAYAGVLEAEPVTSNKVLLGNAFTVPYSEDFSNAENFSLFTVINANNDEATWEYNKFSENAECRYAMENQDDWLIVPPVKLETGKVYKLSFNTRCASTYYPERMEIKMGTEPTVEGMGTVLLEPTVISDNRDEGVVMDIMIRVDKTSDYYIGFHCISDADTHTLFIDDINIDTGSTLATPDKVTDFNVEETAPGSLKAKITLKAPMTTIAGDEIKELESIELYRGQDLIKTFYGPAPGETLEYTDENGLQGESTYMAVAVNSEGRGIEEKFTIYMGVDVPGVPENIYLKDVDGKAVLTWEAPKTGQNGGYIDPDALTYYVRRENDRQYVAQGITELTCTDTPDLGEGQSVWVYSVYAVSAAGSGVNAASNPAVFGQPYYQLPFSESFTGASLSSGVWSVTGEYFNQWMLAADGVSPDVTPQDNDGGMVSFEPLSAGSESSLFSGKIDINGSKNSVMQFYYYSVNGSTDKLFAEVLKEGAPAVTLLEIPTAATGSEQWTLVTVPLKDYLGSKYIQVSLRGVSGSGSTNMHVDNIRVRDLLDNNLSVSDFRTPVKMKVGEKANITVKVLNNGVNNAENYTVELYRNGKAVASQEGTTISPDAEQTYTFTETADMTFGESVTYYAKVNYAADEKQEDNVSAESKVNVHMSTLPNVTDLSATEANGSVSLKWSEPDMSHGAIIPMTDDMEDYESFIISNIGNWTVKDVDGSGTYYLDGYSNYPNVGAPMAYQVFDTEKAGLPITNSDGTPSIWAAHSGNQMLASFGDIDDKNDNWLISPELPGMAQTISFYAKSTAIEYPESYEVLASSTDKELTSFTKVSEGVLSDQWEEITASLPEGTRYFAIRCTTEEGFVMWVDDITCTPLNGVPDELSLIGYNVYRDGERITASPVVPTKYTDKTEANKEYRYRVTAVYGEGESAFSNEVVISVTSSIDASTAASTDIQGKEKAIEISNANGLSVMILTSGGEIVYKGTGSSVLRVPVPNGIYVVKAGGKIVKVAVK